MAAVFDLQGHRGARGLRPENTLCSFEAALDAGVSSIETDVHLTRDGVAVLIHDSRISPRIFRIRPGSDAPDPQTQPLVSSLTRAQLGGYCADRNPDPARFPDQDARPTPLAIRFGLGCGLDPHAPPTLAELFEFTAAYTGDVGRAVGKSEWQRARAQQVRFDLELKRIPFHPEFIGDGFPRESPGLLERRVIEEVHHAEVVDRTAVRSFDHRAVQAVRRLEPALIGAVLVAGTAPVAIATLLRLTDAQVYCPEYLFLDETQVCEAHAEGYRVLPWTVNDPAAWCRLIDWGVDGITTDFPDLLAETLRERRLSF